MFEKKSNQLIKTISDKKRVTSKITGSAQMIVDRFFVSRILREADVKRYARGSEVLSLSQNWNKGRRGYGKRAMAKTSNLICVSPAKRWALLLSRNFVFSRILGVS